jgi:YrbI family 3-deoxy-D-manno-octulosonate 8-phosphate phosphatase
VSAVAVIPARGGSKRVPGKNLRPLAGVPLLVHTIKHALAAEQVGEVIVSTDDPEIAAVARGAGAEVVDRPPELSGDEATSESAVLHALDRRAGPDPELVVLLQATSPVRATGDVDGALAALREQGADSLLSVTETKRFVWEQRDGAARALNYDPANRRREQDFATQYQENGSIYVTRTPLLRETGNRLGGRVGLYVMGYWTQFQLDDPEDGELLEWILARPEYAPPVEWPDRLDLVVFDFDGVMTDNSVVVSEGKEAVIANRGDGLGIEMMRNAGMRMLVLSKERNPVVAARCEKLKLPCIQGIDDKVSELRRLFADEGIDPARTVYVGNDVNDLGPMGEVGLPVAVADAEAPVRAAARLVLSRAGGRGAVRELCDMVLARYAAAP